MKNVKRDLYHENRSLINTPDISGSTVKNVTPVKQITFFNSLIFESDFNAKDTINRFIR